MDDFKQDDPNVLVSIGSAERRATDTIIVEKQSAAAWWALGIVGGVVVLAFAYFLTRPSDQLTEADLRLAQAEATAQAAQQNADAAILQSQIGSARDSVAVANAETATARADAIRAEAEARAAEARAATTVVVERPAPEPSTPNGVAVVTPTAPQPGN